MVVVVVGGVAVKWLPLDSAGFSLTDVFLDDVWEDDAPTTLKNA